MAEHMTMQELPESERPYEKFLQKGVEHLSDAELLSIIIKNGTKEKTAAEIARELLCGRQGNLLNLYELSYEELLDFPGIGKVKAIQLKAVAELSRRITSAKRYRHIRMDSPDSVAEYYMEQMRHCQKEILITAFFDVKCNFLGDSKISQGSISSAFVSPRDIFRTALLKNAAQIIMLHNHPSGDPQPSGEDIRITEIVCDLGKMMGIDLADHIIIGDNEFYSFKECFLI